MSDFSTTLNKDLYRTWDLYDLTKQDFPRMNVSTKLILLNFNLISLAWAFRINVTYEEYDKVRR